MKLKIEIFESDDIEPPENVRVLIGGGTAMIHEGLWYWMSDGTPKPMSYRPSWWGYVPTDNDMEKLEIVNKTRRKTNVH